MTTNSAPPFDIRRTLALLLGAAAKIERDTMAGRSTRDSVMLRESLADRIEAEFERLQRFEEVVNDMRGVQ